MRTQEHGGKDVATDSPVLALKSGEYPLASLLHCARTDDRDTFDATARQLSIRTEEIETAWIYSRAILRDRARTRAA